MPPQLVESGSSAAGDRLLYLCAQQAPDLIETAGQLGHFGYVPHLFAGLDPLFAAVDANPPAVILLEQTILSRADETLRRKLGELAARIPLACMSYNGAMAARLEAARIGCQAYFIRPLTATGCWTPWTGSLQPSRPRLPARC